MGNIKIVKEDVQFFQFPAVELLFLQNRFVCLVIGLWYRYVLSRFVVRVFRSVFKYV